MTVLPTNLIVVVGPTASGKSAVAMQLTQRIGGEILSVDSMQVYRGMDIGTAKPTAAERAEVKHHLIDVVPPNETFTVARFVEQADALIADARRRGAPLIATGGTPLYYKALFEGLFEGPSADPDLRRALAEQSNEALHAKLSAIDPTAAARIHINDRKRLVRAIEVHELTGKPISSMQTEWQSGGGFMRHPAIWFGLEWNREELNRRINARVKQMIAAGWADEVRALLHQYRELSRTAAEATGYAEMIAHVSGQLSLDHAAEQIKIATRQLARRQMKWFRRFPLVNWLSGDQPLEQLIGDLLSARDSAAATE